MSVLHPPHGVAHDVQAGRRRHPLALAVATIIGAVLGVCVADSGASIVRTVFLVSLIVIVIGRSARSSTRPR